MIEPGSLAQKIRGFYAIVDRDSALVDELIDAGACVIQLRCKDATTRALLEAARALRRRTAARRSPLVVNDRLDVALAVGADGVHLGQDDLPLADARRAAPGLCIGVSTHDLDQVAAAVAGGADYLGYGPVFATATKANPDPVQGLDALAAAVRAAGATPIVAIGGITPARAAQLHATGVAAAAAIGAVNDAREPGAAARALGLPWQT